MNGSLRSLNVAATIFIASAGISFASESYKIDPARSTIAFKVRQFFATVNGKFTQFSGTIEVDLEHPEKSSVKATIQVKSIDTGIKKRDDHLRSAEFFNVEKFPEITFVSQSVKRTGPESGDVMGRLTMRGVSRPITLRVTLLTPDNGSHTSRWRVTTNPIKRKEFGLLWPKTLETTAMIANDVTTDTSIEAVKAK